MNKKYFHVVISVVDLKLLTLDHVGLCGICTAFSCGGALMSGTCCCCYGCGRPSCCKVYCAGCGMLSSSPFIFGIVSSCIVGWKMVFG